MFWEEVEEEFGCMNFFVDGVKEIDFEFDVFGLCVFVFECDVVDDFLFGVFVEVFVVNWCGIDE